MRVELGLSLRVIAGRLRGPLLPTELLEHVEGHGRGGGGGHPLANGHHGVVGGAGQDNLVTLGLPDVEDAGVRGVLFTTENTAVYSHHGVHKVRLQGVRCAR